jgi:hypothetical protein
MIGTDSASHTGTQSNRWKILDEERRYLEGLLNARFNFYLVGVSLFLFAIFRADSLSELQRGQVLFLGAIVSAVISLAVLRTILLVEKALDRLRNLGDHPYALLFLDVKDSPEYRKKRYCLIKRSANWYMGAVSIGVSCLLWLLGFILAPWDIGEFTSICGLLYGSLSRPLG